MRTLVKIDPEKGGKGFPLFGSRGLSPDIDGGKSFMGEKLFPSTSPIPLHGLLFFLTPSAGNKLCGYYEAIMRVLRANVPGHLSSLPLYYMEIFKFLKSTRNNFCHSTHHMPQK